MKNEKTDTKLPVEIVLNILNNEPNADVELLEHYNPYIISIGTATESENMLADEDLVQEIKIAILKAIPKLRKVLIDKHLSDNSIVVIVATV